MERIKALLDSPCPLADIYHEWQNRETGYMDDIRDTIESRADSLIQQKEKNIQPSRRR